MRWDGGEGRGARVGADVFVGAILYRIADGRVEMWATVEADVPSARAVGEGYPEEVFVGVRGLARARARPVARARSVARVVVDIEGVFGVAKTCPLRNGVVAVVPAAFYALLF